MDDLSERLRQHANWLYGIGTPPSPMTPADFLAAGARIDRLQAELDIARGQLLSNERGDDRRHYVCVCPDCTKPVEKPKFFNPWWEKQIKDNGGVKIGADYAHWALKGWCGAIDALTKEKPDAP